jgi:hypothetical protein
MAKNENDSKGGNMEVFSVKKKECQEKTTVKK